MTKTVGFTSECSNLEYCRHSISCIFAVW